MRQECLTVRAPAKINLFLRVTGRRGDGYHLLQTLMHKVDLYDEVVIQACSEEGVHLYCREGNVPEGVDNLVHRAAVLFLQATRGRRDDSRGVRLSLTKRIPVAAGLGGGSSDAAATLKGLDQMFACGLAFEELAALGVQLGADVPFFLTDAPAAMARGIGDILTPVAPLCGYDVLLINPGFPVSTRWVYQTFALTNTGEASNLKNLQGSFVETGALGASEQYLSRADVMVNDLEIVTVSRYPEIRQLKDELLRNGAVTALMSGSGPTVFGIFAQRSRVEACHAFFKRRFEHTYLVSPVQEE